MGQKWRQMFKAFLADTGAATSAEYALLVTLIALGIIGGVTLFGNTVYSKLYLTSNSLLPFGS